MTPAQEKRIPAVLVHGWNHHPGIWNKLSPLLEAQGIPIWKFDHSQLRDRTLPEIAAAFGEYLSEERQKTGYDGDVDIVCHSLGTCAVRYFLEVLDDAHRERVRQLIGIGPPNNGSALAELFNDPERSREIIGRLSGVFVPDGFNPAADRMVQDVRPGSTVMHRLRSAGTRRDIAYRVIVTANPGGEAAFFPWFEGKTWVQDRDGNYNKTLEGDGIVANRESALPGISLDIITLVDNGDAPLPQPDRYCHIHQPRNLAVMQRVLHYLTVPVRAGR